MDSNHLLKYLDLPKIFMAKSVEVTIAIKQQNRMIEELIPTVKGNEKMADFLIKSAETNEAVESMLVYLKDLLQEVAHDANFLVEGAKVRNKLKDMQYLVDTAVRQREILIGKQFADMADHTITIKRPDGR
jgi:hypothetical protein